MNIDGYPYIFHALPGVSDYIGSDGRFLRLTSPGKGSAESQVNKILDRIEKQNGVYAYLANRIRERVSILLLQAISFDGYERLFPTDIKNDILYGVDVIGIKDSKPVAIDLTQNPQTINHKLTRRGNLTEVIDPNGKVTQLPFVVIHLDNKLMSRVMGGLEGYLGQHFDRGHHYPGEYEIQSYLRISFGPQVEGKIQKYAL